MLRRVAWHGVFSAAQRLIGMRLRGGEAGIGIGLTLLVFLLTPQTSQAAWWQPAQGITWEIQLSTTPNSLLPVNAYDVDLFDTPQATLDQMAALGITRICYFSAGSYEDWRADADQLAPYRGNPLQGWEGEWWIDIRRAEVRTVMMNRLDVAVSKGCEAVDPDNVDGFANDSGLGLTREDQIDYLRFLSDQAHARGLAIGLKNAVELVPDLVESFDFAVNESCFDYQECGTLQPFTAANKPVLQIQYGGKKEARRLCKRANELGFSTLLKSQDLDGKRIACQGKKWRTHR
jgi:hypothetical protein